MYPDSSGEEKQQFAATIRDNTEKLPFPFSLIKFLPHSMFCLITDKLTDFAYFEQKIECQIKTISQIIEEQLINQIDLLKIDVEKAELDVLQGINSEDWIKIKQVIVEVHNINDRVLFIYELLRERGFSKIKQEQDPVFRHLDIYNIYASR
ncbi:FkbM family methyltransferase [Pleurocapsa sp. FMAR1]|uniref:FkbM family methyltransferase n=1 Tax=Pleurocapsa sp. FMAR1 TaxID=3040204 RepID=UPI0029C7D936|nr:FkbM family methyltransferase [Pleurocapsa sp. FMAR1]